MSNTCGTCTKCCEGWLTGTINGRKMYPGKPCHFVKIGKGCGIYSKRPEDPCKTFKCGWLLIEDMPEEFKPENSGVIMHYTGVEDIGFWVLTKAPNSPTPQFLSWAIVYARSRHQNIVWYVDDRSWWLGNPDFCLLMEKDHNG